MRGMQFLPTETMLLLVLLVVFAVTLGLLAQSNERLNDVTDCELNPTLPWCVNTHQAEDSTARVSATAVACAISSVGTGESACPPEVKYIPGEQLPGASVGCGQRGKARTEVIGSTSVDAGKRGELVAGDDPIGRAATACAGLVPGGTVGRSRTFERAGRKLLAFDCQRPRAEIERDAELRCQAQQAVRGELKQELALGTALFSEYFCEQRGVRDLRCTVRDFDLPQRIDDAGVWSELWGDPAYLVYWQSFPVEEVTWTYETNYYLSIGVAALSVLPVGKVAGGLTKAVAKAGWEGGKQIVQRAGLSAARTAAKEAALEVLKKRGTEILAERLSKEGIRSTVLRAGKAFGITTAAQWAAELWDSMKAKFDVIPNALVLKQPSLLSQFREKYGVDEYELDPALAGKPVLSKWPDHALWGLVKDEVTTFHLASPCYLNEIAFEQLAATCGVYTLNRAAEGLAQTVCTDPELGADEEQPACGTFTAGSFGEGGAATYGTVRNLLESDKRLFTEANGRIAKLALPAELAPIALTDFSFTAVESRNAEQVYDDQQNKWKKYVATAKASEGTVSFFCTELLDGSALLKSQDRFTCALGTGGFLSNRDTEAQSYLRTRASDNLADQIAASGDWLETKGLTEVRFGSEKQDSGFAMLQIEKDDVVFLFTSADNRAWDELTVTRGEASFLFADIDADGNPQVLTMRGCRTSAVVAQDLNPSTVKGENYCMRHTGAGQVTLDALSYTLDAAAIISVFATGGASGPIVAAFFYGAAAVNVASAVNEAYAGAWPSGIAS